jgi:DNA polymerase (family 10)
MQNTEIARRLEEVAELLRLQGANRYRAQAYYHGAQTLRRLAKPVQDVYRDEGLDGLNNLPDIGPRLAFGIRDLILTGRLPTLDRLRGETDPITLLRTVPGIGPVTAARLHDDLAINSLYDLEAAAHDGRLVEVAGIGKKRLAGFIDSLGSRLSRVRAAQHPCDSDEPTVSELLDVDRQYREQAASHYSSAI